MSKLMRLIVMFDLPVGTPEQRRAATGFRNFLLKDGYSMVQFSVYARVCAGFDAVEAHKKRLRENIPNNGSVRTLLITEKQYAGADVMLGNYAPADDPVLSEMFTIL